MVRWGVVSSGLLCVQRGCGWSDAQADVHVLLPAWQASMPGCCSLGTVLRPCLVISYLQAQKQVAQVVQFSNLPPCLAHCRCVECLGLATTKGDGAACGSIKAPPPPSPPPPPPSPKPPVPRPPGPAPVVNNTPSPIPTDPKAVPPPQTNNSSSVPIAAIAGGVAGAIVLIALIAAAILLLGRRKDEEKPPGTPVIMVAADPYSGGPGAPGSPATTGSWSASGAALPSSHMVQSGSAGSPFPSQSGSAYAASTGTIAPLLPGLAAEPTPAMPVRI